MFQMLTGESFRQFEQEKGEAGYEAGWKTVLSEY